eukprot:347811-Pyramimonas_sp.AAC.1
MARQPQSTRSTQVRARGPRHSAMTSFAASAPITSTTAPRHASSTSRRSSRPKRVCARTGPPRAASGSFASSRYVSQAAPNEYVGAASLWSGLPSSTFLMTATNGAAAR